MIFVKILLTGIVLIFVGIIMGTATVGDDRAQKVAVSICVTGLVGVVFGILLVIWTYTPGT